MQKIKKKPFKVVDLEPQLRKDAKRKKALYGPYALPANGTLSSFQVLDPISTNCVVLQGGTSIELPGGVVANASTANVYNHHIQTLDLAKKSKATVCPGQVNSGMPTGPSLFVGGAADDASTIRSRFTSADGQFKSGYFVSPKTSLVLISELMKYEPTDQIAYMAIDTEYLEGKPEGYMDNYIVPVSVVDCKEISSTSPLMSTARGVEISRFQ